MIAGKIAEKPRHYIVGRMPAFPAYADAIAQGLSHWHGFPEKEAPASVPASAITAELVAAGGKLLGEGGGFACTVCHDLGKAEATAPFEAPALNLAWVPSRLRLSYYERWLKNPQRLDSETKMPRYFDIGMRSQLKDVLGGDGHQQINAIRQYLQSIQTAP
jgi:mono/diheme cytochrome c family protein